MRISDWSSDVCSSDLWEVNFLREKLPATFIFQFWEFPHLWWLAIAKKAKDQAKIFARGISFQANICRISRGFGREILALAASIEFPTVIAATDTITLDPSISEAHSQMRTTILPEPTISVGTELKGSVSTQNFSKTRLSGHVIQKQTEKIP